jgi:hypothetical protein
MGTGFGARGLRMALDVRIDANPRDTADGPSGRSDDGKGATGGGGGTTAHEGLLIGHVDDKGDSSYQDGIATRHDRLSGVPRPD